MAELRALAPPEDTVWALDVDRTLFQTNLMFPDMARYAEELGIVDAAELDDLRIANQNTGYSFDTMGELRKLGATEAQLAEICEELGQNKQGIDYLYPGGSELLQTLDHFGHPIMPMTYGAPITQIPKLQSSGLDKWPYIITSTSEKSREIRKSREGDTYRFRTDVGEIIVAKAGVLVEDKPSALVGLPENWQGILVVHEGEEKLPSQEGEVSDEILVVHSLVEITQQLRELHGEYGYLHNDSLVV